MTLELSFAVGFQILFVVGWQREQLSLSVPLPLGKRPASEWLRALEYAISYSLASGLTETYASLPAHLKGSLDVLTEQQGMCEVCPAILFIVVVCLSALLSVCLFQLGS